MHHHPTSPSSISADTYSTSPFHDQDTLKEVYASPDAHYLGTPINKEPTPIRSDDFPEVKPSEDLEVSHKPSKFVDGGYYAPRGPGGIDHGAEKIVVTDNEPPLPPVPASDWKKSWNVRILLVIGGILIIIAVILGAVLGSRAANNKDSNGNKDGADGSATSSSVSFASSMTVTTTQTGSITTTATVSPATKTVLNVETPESSAFDIGRSYNASFTRYGTNDGTGGSNCNVALNGCGFYSKPGYAAGVSQNLYGTGPGKGKGPACGTCWFLETFRDASGNALKNNITVVVNDLCPANDGGVCRQTSLDDLNSWEAQVDFNLCTDSGASDAMFGANSGIGLAVGRATRVDCKTWVGEIKS